MSAASGASTGGVGNAPLPPPKIGLLGRLWAKGSGLSEKQAATGLPAASMSTVGTALALPATVGLTAMMIGTIIATKHGNFEPLIISSALTAALTALSASPFARWAFHSLYKKSLNESEIDHLLESSVAATSLETAYLQLVRDAIRQNAPTTPEAEAEVQNTILSLGEAIDRLPVLSIAPVDTAALRRDAELLQTDAATNPDRVIADSLERRADALLRRAESSERSALAVRRNAALRAEIEAQIAALHAAIGALDAGDAVGTTANADLQHLAESARRLAAETVSVEDARAELNAALAPTPTEPVTVATATDAEPLVQRAGSR